MYVTPYTWCIALVGICILLIGFVRGLWGGSKKKTDITVYPGEGGNLDLKKNCLKNICFKIIKKVNRPKNINMKKMLIFLIIL